MKRALVVCPGRGSYGAQQLGTIARLADRHAQTGQLGPAPWRPTLDLADDWCVAHGLPGISVLDAMPRFRPSQHARADLSSLLTTTLTLLDYQSRLTGPDAAEPWRPVAVIGNSLGWYSALAVAGAISFVDTLRIVAATGGYQRRHGQLGRQLIYPVFDETWQIPVDPAPLDTALRAANRAGFAGPSIDLGGLMVFAGDEAGLAVLREQLPQITRGKQRYPMVLAGHSAFHSHLLAPMADAVEPTLRNVVFSPPTVPLIDGNGDTWRPIHAEPDGLRAYTLSEQITTPYDFAASLTVAMKEYAPEVIVLLGPGRSLGGAIGQILARMGWRGIRDKAGFAAVQEGETPILWTSPA